MPAPTGTPHHPDVEIIHATGIEGARRARGVVVVIDVLRSFTVSAFALAGGARECVLVRTVEEARRLAARISGAVISAEEQALPVPGIAISNSPTQIRTVDLQDRVLVQRSSSGTQALSEVQTDEGMFAASLVVARATAQACLLRGPKQITLVASADDPEDHVCAAYIEGLIRGQAPDWSRLLEPLRETTRYKRMAAGDWPGCPPTDLELSLTADRFDFAMPAKRGDGYVSLTAQPLPIPR